MGFWSVLKEKIVSIFKGGKKNQKQNIVNNEPIMNKQTITDSNVIDTTGIIDESIIEEKNNVLSINEFKEKLGVKKEEKVVREPKVPQIIKEQKVSVNNISKQQDVSIERVDNIVRDASKTIEKTKKETDATLFAKSLKTGGLNELRKTWDKYSSAQRIELGIYDNIGSLKNNKYNIYRNLIMGGIEDQNLVESIYRSGILKDRIMGIVMVEFMASTGSGGMKRDIIEVPLQGLDPNEVERLGILDESFKHKIHTSHQLIYNLTQVGGNRDIVKKLEDRLSGYGYRDENVEIRIISTSVRFDYM